MFSEEDQVDVALDLLNRLAPQNLKENLETVIKYSSEIAAELLSSVDQECEVKVCLDSGKEYLTCDYNRDDSSYRSPWSNKYDPPCTDGYVPSGDLRKLEIFANEIFSQYKNLYFDGGISSVYLWEISQEDFAGVVLIKKAIDKDYSWDSIHVFEISNIGRRVKYKLTSTIILKLKVQNQNINKIDLGGNLTRKSEQIFSESDKVTVIANIGRMIEDMEIKMRSLLSEVYFGKCGDVVNLLRNVTSKDERDQSSGIQREIISNLYQ